jgi:Fic family protein
MQIAAGPIGKEPVHFEAPKADHLPHEMKSSLAWFEGGALIHAVLKAALANLWFVTIHPFDNGSGRIARAIAEMALARSELAAFENVRSERSSGIGASLRAHRCTTFWRSRPRAPAKVLALLFRRC